MKVKDLINKLNEFGYNDETTLSFGFYNYDGDWFDFEIEEFDDDDRECNVDNIGIHFKENEKYKDNILNESNISLKRDLLNIISIYC